MSVATIRDWPRRSGLGQRIFSTCDFSFRDVFFLNDYLCSEAYFRNKLEEDGRTSPRGRVEIGNHIISNPIPDFRARGENPGHFRPSEAA